MKLFTHLTHSMSQAGKLPGMERNLPAIIVKIEGDVGKLWRIEPKNMFKVCASNNTFFTRLFH